MKAKLLYYLLSKVRSTTDDWNELNFGSQLFWFTK